MQEMRYLNLFERVTKVRTRFCFRYNGSIVFGVPKRFIVQSIGPDSNNLRRINQIIGQRIKVVPLPNSFNSEDVGLFIQKIVSPVEFKSIELNDGEVVVNAGAQNKAALIGRDKRRLIEMKKIIKDFFGKDFRIV